MRKIACLFHGTEVEGRVWPFYKRVCSCLKIQAAAPTRTTTTVAAPGTDVFCKNRPFPQAHRSLNEK